jgi:hypothetical protein
MASYNNPLFDMIDRNPIISFFAMPVLVGVGTTWLAASIRKGKTGSYFKGVNGLFDEEVTEVSPMAGFGNVRTEGGDASDLMFRATISSRPTGPGGSEYDDVIPRSTGTPVRYDRNYHDSIFLPNLDYQDNDQVVSQSYPASVTDTFVFAGINGINKIGMR